MYTILLAYSIQRFKKIRCESAGWSIILLRPSQTGIYFTFSMDCSDRSGIRSHCFHITDCII